MKIISLEVENVKRVVAVDITPEGHVVVIGGKNGAGKTSVLDSIAYAYGGKEAICDEPLRKGAKKGHVITDLGDIVVTRTFTKGGGTNLVVTSPEGERVQSPQTLLNRLVGKLTFDPLEFSRMKPAEQRATLQQLVGLDFTKIEEGRAELYSERTDANRTVKILQGQVAGLPEDTEAPEAEVSVADLMAELANAQDTIRIAEEAARDTVAQTERVAGLLEAQKQVEDRIKELESQIAEGVERRDAIANKLETEKVETKRLTDLATEAANNIVDAAPIREAIAGADAINERYRAKVQRAEKIAELKAASSDAQKITRKIDGLDAKKEEALASASFPVEGLAFDEDGVLLNGFPFSQASSAEQVRVSVAMGIAMNPELRVLLIRDGSLLDDDSLGMISEMAAEKDAQIWIERVGEGAEVSVVIEEGEVKHGE